MWVQVVRNGILGYKDLSKLSCFRESQCAVLGIPACMCSYQIFFSRGLVHHLLWLVLQFAVQG